MTRLWCNNNQLITKKKPIESFGSLLEIRVEGSVLPFLGIHHNDIIEVGIQRYEKRY